MPVSIGCSIHSLKGSLYGLDLECSSVAHVLKSWSPIQQYSEVRLLGSDHEIADELIDGFIDDGIIGRC